MKHGIEINGLANLHILLDNLNNDFAIGSTFPEQHCRTDYHKAKEQLVLLERYMIAYCSAINKGEQPPHWHDVRNNPNQYPTNRERSG